jgi:hypothetical protein
MKSPHIDIISDVDDNLNLFGRNHSNKAAEKLGCSAAAGQDCVHAAILRGSERAKPELLKILRQDALHRLNLPFIGLAAKKTDNGLHDILFMR